MRVPRAVRARRRLRVRPRRPVHLHEPRPRLDQPPREQATLAPARPAVAVADARRFVVEPERPGRARRSRAARTRCRSAPSNPAASAGAAAQRCAGRAAPSCGRASRPAAASASRRSAAAAGPGTSGTGRSALPRMPADWPTPVTAPSWIGPQTLTNPSRPGSGGPVARRDRADRGQVLRDGGTDSPVGEKLSGPCPGHEHVDGRAVVRQPLRLHAERADEREQVRPAGRVAAAPRSGGCRGRSCAIGLNSPRMPVRGVGLRVPGVDVAGRPLQVEQQDRLRLAEAARALRGLFAFARDSHRSTPGSPIPKNGSEPAVRN